MKITFYTAEHLLSSETSDTRYVHDGLVRHFDVSVHYRPDPRLSCGADVIFCRFPKPAPTSFLLDLACTTNALIINDPVAQLAHGTKQNLLQFTDLTVPTIVSDSVDRISWFAEGHGDIVFKPQDRHKGQGIRRVSWTRWSWRRREAFMAAWVPAFGVPVVQPFLEQVTSLGDKRINFFHFEPVSAVLTMPRAGSFLCHESLGGTAFPAHITKSDSRIIERVSSFLRQHDIWWAGIDVIGPFLSEINIATPSMLERADRAHGDTRGLDAVIHAVMEYASTTATVGAA